MLKFFWIFFYGATIFCTARTGFIVEPAVLDFEHDQNEKRKESYLLGKKAYDAGDLEKALNLFEIAATLDYEKAKKSFEVGR